ncbi:MAG: diguanylate cyclase domain-containing protein [Gaiellaceae bacterium]
MTLVMDLTARAETILRRSRAAALACLGAYAAFSVARMVGAPGGDFVDDWVYPALIALAAAFCVVRAVHTRAERTAWAALGAGLTSWCLGEVYYTLFVAPLPNPPAFGVADVLWLGFYPGCLLGMLLLVRSRLRGFTRIAVLEALVAALGITSVGAALVFGGLVKNGGESLPANLAYFFGDLVLLGFVVAVLALTGWRPGRSWSLLAAGVALGALVDGFFLWEQATGVDVYVAPMAALWPTSALLIGFAAWARGRSARMVAGEGLRTIGIASAFAAAAMAVLLLNVLVPVNGLAQILAKATLAAAMARMALAVVQHTHLLAGSRYEALHDSLTGLGNRRKLLRDLERVAAAATPEAPASLIVYDLDGFKRYNDWHGHPAGDRLLARLGTALGGVGGTIAHAYRLGGDEFCVLVRGGEEEARGTLKEGQSALVEREDGFDVRSSAAFVVLPRDAQEPDEVLELADELLYAEKARRGSLALIPKTA